jgi:hypothetical protein
LLALTETPEAVDGAQTISEISILASDAFLTSLPKRPFTPLNKRKTIPFGETRQNYIVSRLIRREK